MARSDLLINLVKATHERDLTLLKRTLEAMVAEERQKQHHVLADRLEEYLHLATPQETKTVSTLDDRVQNLVVETTPNRPLEDLVLSSAVRQPIKEIIEEHHRKDLLRSYSLEPRHRVLLAGPPGNGKTSLAEAIAREMMVPLFVVRYDGVIASYLGETAVRLRRLFDFIRSRECVLFFDEFDTLGKERGDIHETGEIKRVVSSLLLQIDSLPSHVVVVAATNHAELLDRAVWRRFQLRLKLGIPDKKLLAEWFTRFQTKLKQPLGISPATLADNLEGISFSEAEEFCLDIVRRSVLGMPGGDLKQITSERLKNWKTRFGPESEDR